MSYPVIAPSNTWYTSSTPKSTFTTINIVDVADASIISSATESWAAAVDSNGDGAFDNDIMCYINGTTLTIAGNGSGKIYANPDSSYMFGGSSSKPKFNAVTTINGTNILDTSKVTNMKAMFAYCTALSTIDVSNWDISNVTDLHGAFGQAAALTHLDVSKWDTSAVTDMNYTFGGSGLLSLDVSNWDTSKVTVFRCLFQNCKALAHLDVSKWDTSSAENMNFMFYGCSSLGTVDVSNWDTHNVTSFDHMFAHSYIGGIDVSGWNTAKATNMYGMFHSIANTTIDVSSFDTSKVIVLSQMFENTPLTEIKGLNNFNTAECIDFSQMFYNCQKLTRLDLSSFDTRKATFEIIPVSENGGYSASTAEMLDGTVRLQEIKLGENFTFLGDGTTREGSTHGSFMTPNSAYIPGADGKWYTDRRVAYDPADIPNNTAATYYASMDLVNDVDYRIKNGTIFAIADAIRSVSGTKEPMSPIDMPEMILNSQSASAVFTGEATGEYVIMEDVAPAEHNLEIKVQPKNWIDFSQIMGRSITQNGTTIFWEEGNGVTAVGTATGYNGLGPITIAPPVGKYTLTASGQFTNFVCQISVMDASGATLWTQTVTRDGHQQTVDLANYPTYSTIQLAYKRNNNGVVSGTMYTKLETTNAVLSGVEVTRCGKNLVDQNTLTSNGAIQEDGSIYYSNSNALSGKTIFTAPSGVKRITLSYDLKTLNATGSSSGVRFNIYYTSGDRDIVGNVLSTDYTHIRRTSREGYIVDRIEGDYGSSSNSTWIKNLQIEIGTKETEYETPVSPMSYTSDANGIISEITSVSPITILTTNSDTVALNCTYHRDINRLEEMGKKAEYNRFWDTFQYYGTKRVYQSAFWRWNSDNFYPKYDIIFNASNGDSTFRYIDYEGGHDTPKRFDLAQRLQECGIRLDTFNITAASNMFAYCSSLTRVPALDLTNATQCASLFNNCRNLVTVDKIILPATTHAKVFSTAFQRCDKLENIVFEGWICTAMDFSPCTKLTHDSLMSIINALQSGVTSKTLTLGSANLAKLTDEEKAIATGKGWTLA